MAAVKLFGVTILKSQAESEVRQLFEQYEKTLADQRYKMSDDINEWCDVLTNRIRTHSNRQLCNLEREYTMRLDSLRQICHRYVMEIRVHEQLKKTEEVTALLDQCKALKIELFELQRNEKRIEFLKVPTKQRIVMNEDKVDETENENVEFHNNSTVENNGTAKYNNRVYPEIHQNGAFTSDKQFE